MTPTITTTCGILRSFGIDRCSVSYYYKICRGRLIYWNQWRNARRGRKGRVPPDYFRGPMALSLLQLLWFLTNLLSMILNIKFKKNIIFFLIFMLEKIFTIFKIIGSPKKSIYMCACPSVCSFTSRFLSYDNSRTVAYIILKFRLHICTYFLKKAFDFGKDLMRIED